MSLLREIQETLLESKVDVGPLLLKLRLLAARLGSEALELWVKHESDGYPKNSLVPDYRKIPASYRASFSGSFGAAIKNAVIPPFLIEQLAGEGWTTIELRQSIAEVDELVQSSSDGTGELHINSGNLIPILQDKVYKGYVCNDVKGVVSRAALTALQYAVKSRILEFSIKLEKSVPASVEVTVGTGQLTNTQNSAEVTQITNQVFYGDITSITSSGEGAKFLIAIKKGNKKSFENYLANEGIDVSDARELVNIMSTEEAGTKEEPLGLNANKWLVKNIKNAVDGTWKIGLSVATDVITKAALKFYGLQ